MSSHPHASPDRSNREESSAADRPRKHLASRFDRLIAAVLLVAVCLSVYLPGLSTLPPIDRDESRFAQASRQMVEGDFPRDWVVPMVQDRPRLNKPPAIYWIQGSIVRAIAEPGADEIWMYRLASVLGATVAAVVTLWIGASMFGLRCGLLAAVLLAVAPVVVFDAHQARADQVLLASTTIAMALLWKAWTRRRDPRLPWALTVGIAAMVGVGILVKGPVTPAVVGGAAVALAWWGRSWGWLWRLRPFSGVVVLMLVALPWVLLAARELGWEVLWSRILEETVGRASEPAEGHSGPPGYHLVLMVALFWPGSLLAGLGLIRGFSKAWRRGAPAREGSWIVRGLDAWRHRRIGRSPELFLVSWFLPGWIAFELAATKLPHYTLPMYPAIALLAARGLIAASRGWSETRTAIARIGFGIWAGLGIVMVLAPAVLGLFAWRSGWIGAAEGAADAGLRRFEDFEVMLATIAILLAAAIVVVAWRMTLSGRVLAGQLLALVPAVAGLQTAFGLVLPGLSHTWITPRIVAELEAAGAGDRPLAAIGYHEDSLIFATRGRVERIGEADLDAWLAEHPDGVVVMPASMIESRPDLMRLSSRLSTIEGFNYSKGAAVELLLAESRAR